MGDVVKVHGLRELQARMQKLADKVARKLAGQATGAAARLIKRQAQRLAPIADEPYTIEGVDVDPGNLPKKIISKKLSKRQTDLTSEHIVTVRRGAKHGHAYRVGVFQEFGTVHHPAQPFLRPALEQEKGFAIKAMKDKLTDGIIKEEAKP